MPDALSLLHHIGVPVWEREYARVHAEGPPNALGPLEGAGEAGTLVRAKLARWQSRTGCTRTYGVLL
jgi:hypothetical protein